MFMIIVNKDYVLIGKTTEWGVKHYKYWVSLQTNKVKRWFFCGQSLSSLKNFDSIYGMVEQIGNASNIIISKLIWQKPIIQTRIYTKILMNS